MKMIVKNICLLFFVSISFFAKSQTSSNYEVIKNIPYYPESTRSSDNYIKEQNTFTILKNREATSKPELHLSVSLRSFKKTR